MREIALTLEKALKGGDRESAKVNLPELNRQFVLLRDTVAKEMQS